LLDNNVRKRIEIAFNIVCGLRDLLKLDILYLSLKPENILLSQDFSKVKLIDFGFSIRCSERKATSKGGTFLYIAPEQVISNIVTDKTDIYSFGIVLYYMFTLLVPWKDLSMIEICSKFQEKKTPSIEDGLNNFENIPKFAAQMIVNCLLFNYEERPSVDDLFNQLFEYLK